MANYRAVATGNWSNPATWGGGAVPPNGAGHNIYSNNFTVTIDQDINVALLTNAAVTASFVGGGTSAAAAGGFTVSQNGITISASSITNGANTSTSVYTLNFTGTNFATFTLIGNILGMSIGGGNPSNCYAVVNSSNGTLNFYGNITGGNSNGNNSVGLFASSGTTNIFNSNINGGGGGTATFEAIRNSGGSVNISNSLLTPSTTNVSVNNSSGAITATNCVFNAISAQPCYSGSGTNRLSGTFISASNGRQPISSAIWFLNTTPTASYIQHALDGINANSFVRFYTADNNLGQANPTDVRSGVSYASGSLTGRLTVPARGSVALSVNYGPSMPFTATRSGTTATATLAYSYPLVVGDQITVTGASNSEWNSTYTIATVVSGTSVTFEVPASHSATAGSGANMQTTGTAALDPASIEAAVQSALTAQGLTSARAGNLDNLDATVSSRLAPSGTLATVTTLTNAPTVPTAAAIASQVRTELATELARVDVATSSRLATSGYTAPSAAPTVTAIRQEMDSNSSKLANLDATVSSRLASSAYSAAPTTAQIATAVEGSLLNEADGQAVLNAIVGAIGNTNVSEVSLVAAIRTDLERTGGKIDSIPTTAAPTAAANATAVWGAATKEITGGTVTTLTNAPTVPSAASIASATRSELATELGRLDAAVSTRLATSGYTAPSTAPTAAANASAVRTELATELAKVAALNTDRLANVATTAIVGNLIAQANS